MKKRSLLALPLLALSLASCGGNDGLDIFDPTYKPFEGQNGTEIKANVTFWHTMGKTLQDEFLIPSIEEFNKIYPNIKIEHSSQGGYNDIKTKIDKAIPAGTGPSMAICYPDHVADYIGVSNGAIRMDGYMTDPKIGFGVVPGENGTVRETKPEDADYNAVEDIVPGFLEEGRQFSGVDGFYCLPFYKSSEAMFYNKTVFEEKGYKVPKTWDEMITLARQIVKDNPTKFGKGSTAEQDGKFVAAPIGYDSEDNMFISFAKMMDIPYTINEKCNEVAFNNDDAKKLVREIKSWYDEGLIVCKGVLPNNAYTSTVFTEQNCYMTIGSTGGVGYNCTTSFEVAVTGLPTRNNKAQFISQGPSICFFDKTVEEETASFLFYKFLTDKSHSAMSSVTSGYAPVRVSSTKTEWYQNLVAQGNVEITKETSLPEVKDIIIGRTYGVFQEYMDNNKLFTSTVFKGSAATREEIGNIIADVLINNTSVDKAFETGIANIVAKIGECE